MKILIVALIGMLTLACLKSTKPDGNIPMTFENQMAQMGWGSYLSDPNRMNNIFYGMIEYRKKDKDFTANSCTGNVTLSDKLKIIRIGINYTIQYLSACEDCVLLNMKQYKGMIRKLNLKDDVRIVYKACETNSIDNRFPCYCIIGLYVPSGPDYIFSLLDEQM